MTCREAERMVMPYIKKELDIISLKAFLNHIQDCENCSEELEIYYTIHRALEQLDNEKDEQYDIHKLLEENIRMTEQKVHRTELFRFYQKIIGAMAAAALLFSVIVQIQYFI